MPREPFKIGDRVRAYGHWPLVHKGGCYTGKVCASDSPESWGTGLLIQLDDDESFLTVHPKQCRRLVKKKRRRLWIDPKVFGEYEGRYFAGPQLVSKYPDFNFLEFVEVKKK